MVVLNQVSDEGDGIHTGVLKVGEWLFLMVHKLMRVTLKHINILRG